MDLPLISICIPLFKGVFLEDTLKSLAQQSYKNVEIVMVNDGDKEDYKPILNKFKYLNIQYYYQENEGAGAARNKAFLLSKGDYIKFMDADDLISADTLLAQVKLAHQNPGHIISGTWGRFFNNDLNTFEAKIESIYKDCDGMDWIIESWMYGPNMTQPGIFLIPRRLILTNGLWKEELSKGPCDDMEFYTRMILNAKGVKFCSKAILYYRSGNINNLSSKNDLEGFQYYLKTIKISVRHLLVQSKDEPKAKLAAANQFQLLAYKVYPFSKDIYELVKEEVIKLGGANYVFPAGGITRQLNNLWGWKNTIRLKKCLGIKKFN
jgi:glycosyltransferase involved in cell wall biosynthesis